MADHNIASLTLHISWPERILTGGRRASTLTSDFAADLLQVQQGEIFDARSDCSL
jgi:hypothetical protein